MMLLGEELQQGAGSRLGPMDPDAGTHLEDQREGQCTWGGLMRRFRKEVGWAYGGLCRPWEGSTLSRLISTCQRLYQHLSAA